MEPNICGFTNAHEWQTIVFGMLCFLTIAQFITLLCVLIPPAKHAKPPAQPDPAKGES